MKRAPVYVPELDRKVLVRAMTDGELRGSGEDVSTRERHERALRRVVRNAVVSPRLTEAQVGALSQESMKRIAEAQMRLHPQTAALLKANRRGGRES